MGHEIRVCHFEPSSPQSDREERFAKDRLRIGRCRDNDLTFEGSSKLSRYHAEVFVAGGRLRVRDLGSRNGTWIDGQRVDGEAALAPDGVLRLGEGGPAIKVSLVETASERANAGAPTLLEDPPKPKEPPKEPQEPPKKKESIGPQTLALAIGALQAQERTKTQKTMALIVAAVTGVVVVVAIAAISIGRRAENEAARHREELGRLEEKIKTGDERIADLEAQIRERDESLEQLKQRQGLSDAERSALIARTEEQLAGLRTELKKNQEALAAPQQVWADIVDRYKESIFLCVSSTRESAGLGTAFAVREDGVLATNAHVVEILRPDAEIFIIQNTTGRVFSLTDRAANPEFRGVSSPDVGLLKIDTRGARLVPLPLADDAALRKIRIGTQLGTLGYPGELAATYFKNFDAKRKRFPAAMATFKDGWIGQITNYRGEAADFPSSTRIQHSASLTGGTSGSPMFTADGKVVALNNSSLDIVVPRGRENAITTKSAAQIGYAIRVDELRRFLEERRW